MTWINLVFMARWTLFEYKIKLLDRTVFPHICFSEPPAREPLRTWTWKLPPGGRAVAAPPTSLEERRASSRLSPHGAHPRRRDVTRCSRWPDRNARDVASCFRIMCGRRDGRFFDVTQRDVWRNVGVMQRYVRERESRPCPAFESLLRRSSGPGPVTRRDLPSRN